MVRGNVKETDPGLSVISNYWVEKARGSAHSNGSFDVGSMMAGLLADKMNKDVPDEELNRFQKVLEERIINSTPGAFGVDYHPDYFLSSVCEAAEFVHETNFPWKTQMYIEYADDGIVCVKVAEGYASNAVSIYKR